MYILFDLRLHCFIVAWDALLIVSPFLSFDGTTYAYLLQVSMKMNFIVVSVS